MNARTPAELAGDAHDLLVAAEVCSRAGLSETVDRYRQEAEATLQQALDFLRGGVETLATRPR